MKGAFFTLSVLAYTTNGAPLSSRSIFNINLGSPLAGLTGQLTDGLAGSVLSTANGAANGVADTANSAASNVALTANGAVSSAAGTVGGTTSNAVNSANGVVNTASDAISSVDNTANSAVNNVANTAGNVGGIMSELGSDASSVSNSVGNIGSIMGQTAGNMVQDAAQGTDLTVAAAFNAADSVEQTIAKIVSGITSSFLSAVEDAAQTVSGSAMNAANDIYGGMGQAVASAQSATDNMVGSTNTAADQLLNGADSALKAPGTKNGNGNGNFLPKPHLPKPCTTVQNAVPTPILASVTTPLAGVSSILPGTVATAADPATFVNMFSSIMSSLGLNGAISAAPELGADSALAAANLGLNTAKATEGSIQNLVDAFDSFAKVLHENNALVNSTVQGVKIGKYGVAEGANDVLDQYRDTIEHMATLSKAIVESGNGDIVGQDLRMSQDLINNMVGQFFFSVRYAMGTFDSNPAVRATFHSAVSYLNQNLLAAAVLHETLAAPIYAALAPVVTSFNAISAL